MYPYIIWTEPRSVGTALSSALGSVCNHPRAPDDPFMYGANPGVLNAIYEQWCRDGMPGPIYRALRSRIVFKHTPETFDDNFNADLARAAEHHGYRHIRLIRCNVFAQLASRGVAEQLDAWRRHDTQKKLAERNRTLDPLDIPDLIEKAQIARARWEVASAHLRHCLVVRSEDIAAPSQERRHQAIRRLLRFLEVPPAALQRLDRILSRGGRDTDSIWPLVPNINDLSAALISKGIT